MTLDFDARYTVDGWRGIAFYLLDYLQVPECFDDGEPTGESFPDEQFVIAVMVGDDRKHVVDVDDLTKLDDDDYCRVCGQVGCTHDGRERAADAWHHHVHTQ